MTDLLYAYRGGGDGWDLRMSLRSHAANMANIGRVVVAGEPPDWLSDDVVRVPCDSPHPRKQQNILRAILSAMAEGAVTGPCLYASDDHFVLTPYDADTLPWFSRTGVWASLPTEWTFRAVGWRMTNWRGSMTATRALFDRLGWPADNWSGHFDTHLDAVDLATVVKVAGDHASTPFGYEPSSLFIAAARMRDPSIRGTPIRDRKLMADLGEGEIDAWAADSDGFVSVLESSGTPNFRKWMEARFPEPCRWEKA